MGHRIPKYPYMVLWLHFYSLTTPFSVLVTTWTWYFHMRYLLHTQFGLQYSVIIVHVSLHNQNLIWCPCGVFEVFILNEDKLEWRCELIIVYITNLYLVMCLTGNKCVKIRINWFWCLIIQIHQTIQKKYECWPKCLLLQQTQIKTLMCHH